VGSGISDQEVPIMNSAIRTGALCAAALLAPVVAFAQQSNAPLTRAEVRADLIRLEQAGYNPAMINDAKYPADIQAAEARAAAMSGTGVGGASSGASQSGSQATPARAPAAPMEPSQTGY
jgi:Domain of unknown function (DUF4148)